MVFSSPLFLFYFLPVVLILYYLVPRGQIFWKNLVLLVGSLFFYAWGEPVYVLLMLFSIAMDYGLGLWLEHEKRRGRVLALAVVLNLLLLGFFKYANFLIGTVNGVTGAGLPLLEVSLPIGISFYTFQALSYIIDLYRGEVEVQRSILNFGTYVSLFPQLIAGPIVRMRTVAGADHIVVLEDGHVVQQGTPAELMEQGGLYRRMVELQNENAQWRLG